MTKTAGAKILVEVDHSYATPSRNTSVSLYIMLRAQHLIEMTNSLTRYDFSWCNLDAWCLGKMVSNWIRSFPCIPNPGSNVSSMDMNMEQRKYENNVLNSVTHSLIGSIVLQYLWGSLAFCTCVWSTRSPTALLTPQAPECAGKDGDEWIGLLKQASSMFKVTWAVNINDSPREVCRWLWRERGD